MSLDPVILTFGVVFFFQLTKCDCQIVNLGAGFDTTFWNLKDEGLCPKNFIEVDFQAITTKKCYYIKTQKQLLAKLSTEGECAELQIELLI